MKFQALLYRGNIVLSNVASIMIDLCVRAVGVALCPGCPSPLVGLRSSGSHPRLCLDSLIQLAPHVVVTPNHEIVFGATS